MTERGCGFGVGVSAVGAGVGVLSFFRAGRFLGGCQLIVVYLCRRICVQRAVRIESTGNYGSVKVICV